MRDGARAQAAIEVLEESQKYHRVPAMALKDWALKHRFAGSKDRSAIGDIVFMALRMRASSAYRLGSDTPRAWVFGALVWGLGQNVQSLIDMSNQEAHSFSKLDDGEIKALECGSLDGAQDWQKGDYPQWIGDSLERVFGDKKNEHMAQMAKPAPLDLRVNIAKATRENVLSDIKASPKLHTIPSETPLSPWGIRIPWSASKSFQFNIEPAFLRGEFEVQDEASQLCALLTGAKPKQKIADVCAGGGGKTLALAAMCNNDCDLIAYDLDANRIAPIHERLRRAGVNCVDVRTDRKGAPALANLGDKMDIVLIDAPCTGSGTWRRAPDTKWRLTPQNLSKRQSDQASALDMGAQLVRYGGHLFYVTCSILPEENDDSVANFLDRNKEFFAKDIETHLNEIGFSRLMPYVIKTKYGIQFTPLLSDTDGFYLAALKRVDK